MYFTRIPAMQRLKIDPNVEGGLSQLPRNVRSIADNYNHLMEQPTIFYALIVYLYLTHMDDALNVSLAWAYVGLRVVHSLVQNTVNFVPLRFLVFTLSTLAIVAMVVRAVMAIL
eukprot:gene17015-biopygen10357